MIQDVLSFLVGLPPAVTYLVLGVGAAVENVFPPIPADTFVLLGGFVAALGEAHLGWIFAVTWGANVLSALVVYLLAFRYGPAFFRSGWGRRLLDPGQLETLRSFYRRWGVWAIFMSRFLPGFRAMVPVFAGISHVTLWRVSVPMAIASGLWYGGLVWLGATAGRRLDTVLGWVEGVNRGLLAVALALAAAVAAWWWRSRKGRKGAKGKEG